MESVFILPPPPLPYKVKAKALFPNGAPGNPPLADKGENKKEPQQAAETRRCNLWNF